MVELNRVKENLKKYTPQLTFAAIALLGLSGCSNSQSDVSATFIGDQLRQVHVRENNFGRRAIQNFSAVDVAVDLITTSCKGEEVIQPELGAATIILSEQADPHCVSNALHP